MKIFLSWSGDLSHKIALIFQEWVPSVLQNTEPYISSEDINKGARWSSDIAGELENSTVGIILVTPENIEAPWIHFEAGALSKVIDKSYVCPFLFGVKRKDVKGPLVQFQSTIYEKEDIKKLLFSINAINSEVSLPVERLEKSFNMWWPDLSEKLEELTNELDSIVTNNILQENQEDKEVNVNKEFLDILEEILELTRNQQRILSSPEELIPPKYISYILRKGKALNFKEFDIHPKAIRDLRRGMDKAEKILHKYQNEEKNVPIKEFIELISLLKNPINHIFEIYRSRDEVAITSDGRIYRRPSEVKLNRDE